MYKEFKIEWKIIISFKLKRNKEKMMMYLCRKSSGSMSLQISLMVLGSPRTKTSSWSSSSITLVFWDLTGATLSSSSSVMTPQEEISICAFVTSTFDVSNLAFCKEETDWNFTEGSNLRSGKALVSWLLLMFLGWRKEEIFRKEGVGRRRRSCMMMMMMMMTATYQEKTLWDFDSDEGRVENYTRFSLLLIKIIIFLIAYSHY